MESKIITNQTSFQLKITNKIGKIAKKAIEKYASEVFLPKLKKLHNNGGYGVRNVDIDRTLNSYRNWKVIQHDTDGNFRVGFVNNSIARQGDEKYIKFIYTSAPHRHRPEGYASSTSQGFTKDKVDDMKRAYKDGCQIAVAKAFRDVKVIKVKKGKL